MDLNYKAVEFELYGALLRARECVAGFPDNEAMLEKLDQGQARIKSKKYNVAVVGEFRRGKSSLINALLGLPVLPSDVTPTTATINRITYGSEPAVTIYFKDGGVEEIADIARLADYVTKISEEREATAKTVKEAVVKYPIVVCQNHVDIIDTPGLDDDEAMTAVTIGMLDDIDAAIVTVSALSPFSETERRFVARLIANRGITNIVFAVTFIDELDDDDYDRVFAGIASRIYGMVLEEVRERHAGEDWIQDKARRILDDMAIYGVSSKKALQSFVANDRKLLKQSRFVAFKEGLYAIVTAGQSVNMVEKAVQAVQDALAWANERRAGEAAGWKRKRADLDGLRERVRDLFAASHRKADAFLTRVKPDADQAFRFSPDIGAPALSVFVKHLAGVRERRSDAVRAAIIGAGMEAAELFRSALADAAGAADAVGERLAEQFPEGFSEWLEAAGALRLDSVDVGAWRTRADGLLRANPPAKEPPAFKWSGQLWPKAVNLLDVNVIDHIKAVIGQTAAAMDAAMAERGRLWRKGVFAAAAAMERDLAPRVLDALDEAARSLDAHEKALGEKRQGQLATLAENADKGEALLQKIRREPATENGTRNEQMHCLPR